MANVGGLLGLCIGLSIVTVIEVVWLGLRMGFRFLWSPDLWSQEAAPPAQTTLKTAWE
jgi:hypothetical protein